MELSHPAFPISSFTTRFLQHPKNSLTEIPPKMSYRHRTIPLINLRRPENSFPKIAPVLSNGRKTVTLVKATTGHGGAAKSFSPPMKSSNFSDVLLRFVRPHVLFRCFAGWIYGIILGNFYNATEEGLGGGQLMNSGTIARVWMENHQVVTFPGWILFLKTTAALVAIVCAASFISGINHIYDIEIDRINKPDHPVVSGELSLQFAWMLNISFVVIGITISLLLKSGPLLAGVLCMVVFGILYSVPPFSMKKSTFGAVFINTMLGLNFGLSTSLAARTIIGLPLQLSVPIIYITTFDTLFKLASAVMKDTHDLEGDKKFNVPTLVSIHGPKKVAYFGFGCMLLDYVGAIATAILFPQVFKRNIMIPAHVMLAAYVIFRAWKLEKENYSKEASKSFYVTIFLLLNVEYLLFPFI